MAKKLTEALNFEIHLRIYKDAIKKESGRVNLVSDKVIFKLLEHLERALKRLESKKNVTFEEFDRNWELHGAILHELQIAIQSIIDIGTHLIAELGLKSPNSYGEIADILAKK